MIREWVHHGLRAILLFLLLLLCWTVAYMSTHALYTRFHWELPELIILLVDASLGCLLFSLGIGMASRFMKPRADNYLAEILGAMTRISRGDFRVKLDLDMSENKRQSRKGHPIAKLVDSMNTMAANLKEMEELRQEFISNVSHEIGSPLTSINGFAKALKNDRLDAETRMRYLTIIETECERLSKVSDNLMKLAVLDASQQPLRLRTYRLDQQIVALVLACEPKWAGKAIDMSVETEKLEIHADEDLLGVVWTNLIHNSVKFTPQEGSIHLSLVKGNQEVEFRIADTGPGIPLQDQPRIFERFYKVDQARSRTDSGSGLGLSIAQKIIELHQGSISIYSKPGEGAEFVVRLPLEGSEVN